MFCGENTIEKLKFIQTLLKKHNAQQQLQEIARHGIYLKLERLFIKSFVYICNGQ